MLEGNDRGNSNDFDSSEDFFDQMEAQVNGGIQDNPKETTEVTPPASGPEQVTHTEAEGTNTNNVDWEKRYKDSSRSAQKMADELKTLKPFVPVLNAMKEDSGLVQHVRGYFENGGKPAQSVQERLGLPEDFVYDEREAMENPDSNSAKVFQTYVDGMVQNRVGDVLAREKQAAMQAQQVANKKREEEDFKKRHNMSEDQYGDLVEKAKKHILTLDDVHYLVNRDKVNTNVAASTKKDMLNQMQNARNIPNTASGVNSQGDSSASFEDDVFDALLGSDGNVDNLFG